jgi:hypothetical protein
VAVGVGSLAGETAGAVLLVRAARDVDAGALVRATWRSILVTLAAGGAGLAASDATGGGVPGIVAGGGTAATVFLAGMLIVDRSLVKRARELLLLALRGLSPRPVTAPESPGRQSESVYIPPP